MNGGPGWRTGFTLIELLIVVAIIAILALIAVPNFLEAQTRAKVSRVKADLRTLATGLEAYFVDWNSYSYRNGRAESAEMNGWGGFLPLTTPIAYVTSLPMDPFGFGWKRSQPDPNQSARRYAAAYEMGCGVAGVSNAGYRGNLKPEGFPSNTWEMESDGPDRDDNTVNGFLGASLSTGGYPWPWTAYDNSEQLVGVILSLRYDPTNGSISGGEVYRTGGVVPPGRAMQYFYDGGLK